MSKKSGDTEVRKASEQQHTDHRVPVDATGAKVVVPGPEDVITLPAGTTIATLDAEGRDLLIVLSDGEKILVPDGAVVVPQIVVDGTVVPPINVAALLIDNEVQPAAGPAASSGGNFATGEGAIQAAYGLGNLLPYTELQFGVQPRQEIIPGLVDKPPVVVIETPDNPVGVVDAIATVREAGLPARNGEPAGTGEAADGNGTNNSDQSETTSGTIVFDAPDGTKQVLINGVAIDHVGQTFTSPMGTMTITGIDLAGGQIGFSYTLMDNVLNQTSDPFFQMTVVDSDGDQATATLTVNIIDDAPIAADDTDTLAAGTYGPETGNVITGVGTTSGDAGVDRVGADNAAVSSVGHGSTTVNAAAGTMVIGGDYGTLTLHADGSYSYVRAANAPGNVDDKFTYTLTDGDGSTDSATLTIHIGNSVTTLHVPVAGDAGTQVLEAGLAGPPAGSAAAGNGEFTSGTITYTAPDGPAVIKIGGTTVSAVGDTVHGAHGTLTVTGFSNGTIAYTYELTSPTSGDNTSDSFPVTVTDHDGDHSDGTLVISIADDVPTAVADVDGVTEDGPLVADGNVITGAGGADANTSDGVADVAGADGAHVTAVMFGATAGAVGTGLAGDYGTLTLNADGSYSYALDNGNPLVQGLDKTEHLTETFSYTLTDGDGDTSTTTLTITVNGADDGVTIGGLNPAGAEQTVYENDLADGSSPDAAALTRSGTFTVTAQDGLSTISVGGHVIYTGDAFVAGQTIATAYGTLTLTGVTPTTTDAHGDVTAATVSYSYALTDNTLTHTGANDVSLTDTFAITVTDTDGSTANDHLDVTVVDDVPVAHDDGASVNEGLSVSGTVLTNDVAGADGFAASPTGAVTGIASVNQATSDSSADGSGNYALAGQYGTLTLGRDGTYSYQSNGNSVTGTQHDVFHYTVIDADGDTSTATLDITVNDVSLAADNQTKTVYEAALDTTTSGADLGHGTVTGSTPALTTETVTGALAVAGASSYTLVGSGTGSYGLIHINSDGTYTYTLTAPVDNLPHANDGNDTTNGAETFTYQANDGHGNLTTGTITINVVDDVPVAHDDGASVNEGLSVSGTVLTNDVAGADGFAASPTGAVTGIASVNQATSDSSADGSGNYALAGQYGTLTLGRDGTYSYQSNGNSVTGTQHDVFHYTVIDADGDTSTATLDITVNDVSLAADNQTKTVYEAALDTTTSGADLGHGTVTGSTPALTTETVTGALAVAGASSYTLVGSGTGSYGLIHINSDGTYTYTLTAPVDNLPHANDGNDTTNGAETFTYQANDGHGNLTTGTITINVVDDVPVAHDDGASVNEGLSVSGTVLTNDVAGADGFAASPTGAVTGIASVNQATSDSSADGSGNYALAGQYGTLTLGRDGTYSYQSNGNSVTGTQHDVFHYTVIDADGDTSTATLDITVNDVSLAADNQTKTVYEAALDTTTSGADLGHGTVTGSTPALTTETVTGALAVAGASSYTLVGSGTGSYGLIHINSDGTYTYTLTAPVDNLPHANDGNDTTNGAETFTYQANDGHGNLTTGTITINVVDDVPVAHDDGASVNEGLSVSGTVLTNDVAGADGFAASPTGAVTGIASVNQATSDSSADGSGNYALAGQYGTLTLGRDGTYSYQSNGNSVTGTQHDVFHYTVIDADGDTSTATLDITVNDVSLAADNQTKTVYEAALDTTTSGADLGHGTVTGSTPALTTETVTGALAVAGASSYTLVGSGTGSYGLIHINSDGTYTYTLTAPVDNLPHANDGNDTTNGAETFTYQANDGHGNLTTGTITINVVDDVPVAHDDGASVNEGLSVSGTVLTNDVAGADGFAASPTGAVTGIASVNQATSDSSADGSGNYALAGQYGTLTLGRDGTYSYQSNGNSVTGTQHDVFHYTVIDADGDTSTATLDITVNDVSLAADNQTKTVYEAALDTTTSGADLGHGTVTGSTPALTTETVTGALAVAGASSYTLVGSGTGSYGLIHINSDGTYTYTLTAPVDNLPHANDGNDTTNGAETFTYQANDGHGNLTTGTITINVVDDVPALGTVQNQQTDNDPTTSPAVGTLHYTAGADGTAGMVISANMAGITSGGLQVMTYQSGNTLIGFVDDGTGHPANGTYDAGDDTKVFSLIVDPTAGTSGQYTFDLVTALDPTITNVPIGSGSSFGVGPSSEVVVTDNTTSQQLVYVTGWAASAGFDVNDPTTWDHATQRSDVNGSSVGWGLGNNNFDTGEFLRFDFGTLNDYDGAGGYSPPGTYNITNASYATFEFKNFSSGDHIVFVAHYTDGSAETFALDGATAAGSLTIHAHAGSSIAWIDSYESAGSIKLNLTNVGVASSSIDKTLPFSLHFVDGDGDVTATQNFTVHVADGLTPAVPAAPVVLDLDGNGLGFLDLAAGVTHDYGTGVVATAWVAPEDGLLAHNTGSGLDVVFSDDAAGAKTDLQGLALAYDSNHDGQLTAADTAWNTFGVWQDANSNGVVDAGEFKTLAQAGISAISLSTDGQSYTTANGDVTVAGTGSYTRTDGTVRALGDTAFATAAQKIGQQTTEHAALAAALGGFIGVPLAQPAHVAPVSQPALVSALDGLSSHAAPAAADVEHTYKPVSAASVELSASQTQSEPQPSSSIAPHELDTAHQATLPEPSNDRGSAQVPMEVSPAAESQPSQAAHAPSDVMLMDALLTLHHPAQAAPTNQPATVPVADNGGTVTTQDLPNVAAVLHDALAGHVVDQIVDKLTGGNGPAVVALADPQLGSHPAGTGAIAVAAVQPSLVLDVHLDAQMGGHAAVFAAMAAMPMIEEHALVVAA